jgi:hypothetical protein
MGEKPVPGKLRGSLLNPESPDNSKGLFNRGEPVNKKRSLMILQRKPVRDKKNLFV